MKASINYDPAVWHEQDIFTNIAFKYCSIADKCALMHTENSSIYGSVVADEYIINIYLTIISFDDTFFSNIKHNNIIMW